MEVIVVGGGIGGLTMALSLHQAGIAVRVYEAVPYLAPLGVGINLQPTAVRELTELGLGDVLARAGIATHALSYFNKFGQLIYTEKRGLAAGYKWPQYSIHRGQLQLLLLQAVRERIGNANFRSGLRFVAFGRARGAAERDKLASFHRDDPKPKDGAEYSKSRGCGRDWRYSITCRRGRAMFREYSDLALKIGVRCGNFRTPA